MAAANGVRTRIQDFNVRQLYIVAVIGEVRDRPLAEYERQAVKITFR